MSILTLDKILQSQGYGSRKECRALVEAGEVSINGTLVRNYKTSYETKDLMLTVFDETVPYREYLYIALNKPSNYECSRKPNHHPDVLSLLPEECTLRNVQTVGRLDHDTTGLILLSDDGAFIHSQSSPKKHIPKVYVATTAYPIEPKLIENLITGVQLHDEPSPLAALSCVQLSSHELEIILEQGKYHQVKRMLAAAGNHCAKLKRVAIGSLLLKDLDLEEGEWRYLTEEQLLLLAPIAQIEAEK